jgi:predicted dehydrogenase
MWLVVRRAGEVTVRSAQGRYHDLYTAFAAAVRGEGRQPVPAYEGIRTLAILDAARLSAQRGVSIAVADGHAAPMRG